MARQIRKSQAFISDVERGRKLPSLVTLLAIAQKLDRSPEYFIPAAYLAGYTGDLSKYDELKEHEDSAWHTAVSPALSGPAPMPGASFLEALSFFMAEDARPWAFLEDDVGLSDAEVAHIRAGYIPPREVVIQIAESLGIDPSRLLVPAGYVTDPDTDRALRALLADKDIRELVLRIGRDFPTPHARTAILELIGSAKALGQQQLVDEAAGAK